MRHYETKNSWFHLKNTLLLARSGQNTQSQFYFFFPAPNCVFHRALNWCDRNSSNVLRWQCFKFPFYVINVMWNNFLWERKTKGCWIDRKRKYPLRSYPLKIKADVMATTPGSINQSIFGPGSCYPFIMENSFGRLLTQLPGFLRMTDVICSQLVSVFNQQINSEW